LAGTGDINGAIDLLSQSVVQNPENLKLSMSLAGLYERNKRFDDAINQYKTILTKKPDNLLANNNLAALLADYKTDEESLSMAKNIADKLKNIKQPIIQDTVGWVYYKTGNYSEAVSVLEQVVTAAPEVNVFNYHLGMAYHKLGDNEKARNHLKISLAGEKDFTGKDEAQKTLDKL
jgi:Flp pilus assembly protein TadD